MSDEKNLSSYGFDQVLKQGPFEAFDKDIFAFLVALSQAIMHHPMSKSYPDLASFGFFIRQANLKKMQKLKLGKFSGKIGGLGVAFHITPSNVPLNFAYSLVSAILCGNPSIVRVSSKSFPQAEILLQLIKSISDKMNIPPWFSIIRYSRDSDLNGVLSERSRIRLIWGGNETIQFFKSLPVKTNVVDVTFPDKYSLALIDTKHYLQQCSTVEVAKHFYDDVYSFDQNACTAPRAVIWLGHKNEVVRAQNIFWSALSDEISLRKYKPSYSATVKQFSELAMFASLNLVSNVKGRFGEGITVANIKIPTSQLFKSHVGEGLFYQLTIENIEELGALISESCQTISLLGKNKSELAEWILRDGILGIDRICKLGSSSSFSIDWDGKDLFNIMTRRFPL